MNNKSVLLLGLILFSGLVTFVSADYNDCVDSDSGLNEFEAGVVEYNGYEYQDHCADGGEISRLDGVEASRGDVIEYACIACTDAACVFSVLKCSESQTCKDGKCVPEIQDPFYLPEDVDCEDSDNGLDYKIKGLVKYRVEDDSVNKVDDYCVTDKELREYYCDSSEKKPMQLSVTECSGVCACGKCFDEGEPLECAEEYSKYCNDESCYILEEDIFLIEFVSKNELYEDCLISENCHKYVGKYIIDNEDIEVNVELDTNVNFVELKDILQKEFDQEPKIGDFAGSDYYVIDKGDFFFLFWISDDKLISIEIPKQIIEEETADELLTKYLELHPSDVEKNLNFFEKVFEWFKNLFS